MAEVRTARAFVSRHRWLIVLGVLVVLRAALPEVLRRVVVSQASQRLGTRVEVGDVALYSPTPQTPDEPPLVSWKRFAVELRYLPLLWKTAQLRWITLDAPHV